MKKYIFILAGLYCALTSAMSGQPAPLEHSELKKSDANIIGHVLDKNSEEHLHITIALKGIDYRNCDRCHGALFPKEPPGGEFCDGSEFGGL